MKFLTILTAFMFLMLVPNACRKKAENIWNIEVPNAVKPVKVIDISAELYNPEISTRQFKTKFPWYQGSVSDEDFDVRRRDDKEIQIYKDAIGSIDLHKLNVDFTQLFNRIQYYFPEFKAPKVYLYSSALQGISEPIFYEPSQQLLFIDITAFMGTESFHYKGLEKYFRISMNPVNIVPKTSRVLASTFITKNPEQQKFLDKIIFEGKIMTLQDAFIPNYPDHLKINYTKKQYQWALQNEVNIWDYFIENNMIYSDDARLTERFINPGPFSKFYTEIDNESSPQIGIFTGWRICQQYFEKNPETKLADFLTFDAQKIFTGANYKPTKVSQN